MHSVCATKFLHTFDSNVSGGNFTFQSHRTLRGTRVSLAGGLARGHVD